MLTLGDVERAIAARNPELGALIVRYLAQADPEPGRSELAPTADDEDEDAAPVDVPAGAVTLARLHAAVSVGGLANRTATERKLARRDGFAAAAASPFAPPRLRLGPLLIELYERGDPAGRAALIQVFAEGTMKWGVWQAAKAIYKRAEDRHDAALYGVLAYRFDAMRATPYAAGELGAGTLLYLRRRAWRYLRLLGQAVSDAYPAFAVEVLRHYPASHGAYTASWVAAQIWGHGGMKGGRGSAAFGPPAHGDPMQRRAFPQAWKLSPAPLLRLLEVAANELVCDWAIRCLRADHPLALRAVEPAWLARLARRPVAAIHGFVVALLRDSPELHQSRLRELGLHDAVLGLLRSASAEARAYALDYAAAHAPDLPVDELAGLIERSEMGGGDPAGSAGGAGGKAPRGIDERVDQLLADVDLADRRGVAVAALSHGECRQLELAVALATAPRVLLLDEPAAGMSPAETERFAALVHRLPAALAILFVEHDLDLVFRLATRVTVLHLGKVLASGAPEEVRQSPAVQEAYLGTGRREDLFVTEPRESGEPGEPGEASA
ncbi:MAG TPA: ATP-binding cassette domain-containing protein [Kofleriaceae bacterium]|nr:ATP-binding cassette domain-containing protein [Kofleriaceae bacterium]